LANTYQIFMLIGHINVVKKNSIEKNELFELANTYQIFMLIGHWSLQELLMMRDGCC
jgi:hypothetical protein